MKKKRCFTFCLFIAALVLMSAFSSCSKDDDPEKKDPSEQVNLNPTPSEEPAY